MTARGRLLVSLAVGALAAPWLPIYPWQAMTRALVVGHGGDVITYAWRFGTLSDLRDALRYMRPEDGPTRTLALDLALACAVALAIAWLVRRLLARTAQRADRNPSR